jgi:hypothetical protein
LDSPLFFDEESERLHKEIPNSKNCRVKLAFDLDFDIGQSYVTSKIQDRQGNIKKLNIQAGMRGIKLQGDLIRAKSDDDYPHFVFVITRIDNSKIFVRKLPVLGLSDWLLIFEEDLFLLAVKNKYEEIEILG